MSLVSGEALNIDKARDLTNRLTARTLGLRHAATVHKVLLHEYCLRSKNSAPVNLVLYSVHALEWLNGTGARDTNIAH